MKSSCRKIMMKSLRRPHIIAHRFQFQAKQRKETRAKLPTFLMHIGLNSKGAD